MIAMCYLRAHYLSTRFKGHIVTVSLLALSLCSCELVLDAKLPRDPDRLVINGILNTDSTFAISVSASRFILDQKRFAPLAGATVSITDEDGNVYVLQQGSSGNYESDVFPVAGRTYSINAFADGFVPVVSQVRVPDPITVKNLELDTVFAPSPNSAEVVVRFQFDDPGLTENYYEVRSYQQVAVEYRIFPSEEIIRDTMDYQTVLRPPGSNPDDSGSTVFSDKFFNGKTFSFESNMSIYQIPGSKVLETKLVLLNISSEYHKYRTTVNLQQNSEGDPFSQPVQVYNNIEKGFGIFAGISRSVFFLRE